jgi:hypothetical protein
LSNNSWKCVDFRCFIVIFVIYFQDRTIDEKRDVLQCIANEILERFPAMNAEHVIDRLISCDGDVDKEIRNIVSEFNQVDNQSL